MCVSMRVFVPFYVLKRGKREREARVRTCGVPMGMARSLNSFKKKVVATFNFCCSI